MKTKLCTVLLLLMCYFSDAQINDGSSYQVIYEADKDGEVIAGNRDALIQYIQTGNPIRVGWVIPIVDPVSKEQSEMWHWTDAGFITVLNGHVFTQIRGIFAQGPGLQDNPNVFLLSNEHHSWVAVIGTTGVMRQKFHSEKMKEALLKSGLSQEDANSYIKEQEKITVGTKWAVMKN